MKNISIKDVARKLNCSVSTVSRAFNDKYDIKTETRALVLKTAKEMGYRPNPIARKLIQQRSFNVGIVVPEFTNGFFPEVIIGIQEVLFKKGYQVLIMQSNESWETEQANVQTLVDNRVDGLIVSLTCEIKNKDYYLELIKANLPVVFFNRVLDGLPASQVLFDDYKWAFFATEHLILQGYTAIVHLAGAKDLTLTKNRIEGFKAAHKKHRVATGDIIYCGFSMQDGERVAKEMIEKDTIPGAIFSASDLSAIGAMNIFKKNGFQIPKEIAFAGFSESSLAEHIAPSLTSVEQPTNEIGRTAAQLLLNQIENPGLFVPQTIVLNGRLNIRESSIDVSGAHLTK